MCESYGQAVYRIRVRGRLDERWSDWFNDLTVETVNEGENLPVTIITGVIDQAALRGILNKVWDLNLSLISVVPIEAHGSRGGAS
jgi:hypothetical protein